MSLLKWMGVGQAEPAPPPAVVIPGKERTPGDPASKMFGMENFGNTCYANSILQALYFCQPFRDLVCVTPDGRPLPEIPIASLVEQVALPAPPPKEAAGANGNGGASTASAGGGGKDSTGQSAAGNGATGQGKDAKVPGTPGLGGPKLSFKRQNSATPVAAAAAGTTTSSAPSTDGTPSLAGSVSAASSTTAADGITSSNPGPTTTTTTPGPDGTPSTPTPLTRSITSLPPLPPSIFSALRALFLHISLNVEEKGLVSPSAFIAALKKENPEFRTSQHQDAHEFLNYLLNRVAEDIDENRTKWEEREREGANGVDGDKHELANGIANGSAAPTDPAAEPASQSSDPPKPHPRPLPSSRPTLIQHLFQGQLTNETRCLNCNTVSHRDETFLDLSIDIEPNSSVTACLREFSKGEMLREENRFMCECCNMYCDAEKRMKVKSLPNILALHLKRFKYIEDANRNIRPTKLTYRVAFPLELRLFDTSDDALNPDRLYELFAIVVHIGAGLAHGHYVTVVRAQGKWILFDDDTVDVIKESDIMKYFGDAPGGQGYVLFYQAVDIDVHALGLPDRQHSDLPRTTIPPPAFPPEWSSEKQFADNGIVYTPYAGTSQAAAAASLVPLPPPTPAPPTPTPAQQGKKGLKLDIPATPKFDPSATLNSLRSLAGPLTMPTPGSREQNGGFFSRTLRHSQSKIDKTAAVATPTASTAAGGLVSPITAQPVSGSLPSSMTLPQLKQRPSSRGKDAAAWFAGKMGKEKRREGDAATTTADTNASTTPSATPMMRDDSAPPVPPLPPLPPSALSGNGNGNGSGPDSPLFGLGITDQRRPSLPGSLERVQEAVSPPPHTPPALVEEPASNPPQQSPGFFSPAGPGIAHRSTGGGGGMLSPPISPAPPISPSSRTSSSLQAAAIPESPIEEAASGRSQSVEAPQPRPVMHRQRPSTASGPVQMPNGPLNARSPPEEGKGGERARGRRMSRDDSNDKPERKWYQRIGKNKDRPSTAGGMTNSSGKSEGEDDYAILTSPPPPPVEVIDLATPPEGQHSFVPPVGRHHYVPPRTEGTEADTSIDNSSTTSSDEKADQTGPLPVPPTMSPSMSLPPSAFPTLKSAPASPNRAANDSKPEPPKPKRKLSMNKPSLQLSRLSWFGSSNNLKDAAGGTSTSEKDNGASGNAPLTPTTESKKSRNPLGR